MLILAIETEEVDFKIIVSKKSKLIKNSRSGTNPNLKKKTYVKGVICN